MDRYSRQIVLKGFGKEAQLSLFNSRVLIIGCGGLGSPVAEYLARAGVGSLTLMDGDRVSLSNLHRQLLFVESDIGKLKVEAAQDALQKINRDVRVQTISAMFTEDIQLDFSVFDVIVEATDQFSSKYLADEISRREGIPMVYGAVNQWSGQITSLNGMLDSMITGGLTNIFPVVPEPGELGSCEENGVIGSVAGFIANQMATEVIKIITGLGYPLFNRMMHYDAYDNRVLFTNYSVETGRSAARISADEISWSVYDISYAGDSSWKLVDVRTTEERGVHPTDSITPDQLIDQQPIFHCKTGVRAFKSYREFKSKNPHKEARYITGDLPSTKIFS